MKFGIVEFVIGIWLGAMIFAMLLHFVPGSNYNLVVNAMAKCERSPPRDQKCVITAVPEVK